MSNVASKTATPVPSPARPAASAEPQSAAPAASSPEPPDAGPGGEVERALAAAARDAGRIGELLDALRSARLWLPLPDDGAPPISGSAVRLPTVSYLGCDFVPAYSSADLMLELTAPDAKHSAVTIPHAVVQAKDLARLLPPAIGIALNAGASESVPVYPQGVSYLADDTQVDDLDRLTVGPLPVQADGLLATIAAGLAGQPAVAQASAAWLSVRFAGEGLLVSVTLDDPADEPVRDAVIGVIERAAWTVEPEDSAFPIDVTFPGETEPDHIDQWVTAFAAPFYRR